MAEAAALTAFAPAKVNLYLHVTGRRADGFHLLDSLIVFAGVGDRVQAVPGDDLTLAVDGPFAGAVPTGADNLVLRAARALAEAAGVPPRASIVLTKGLPVAAGLGGGSSDAAAVLRTLSRLWNVVLPAAELAALAIDLGADVPVCLAPAPTFVGGIGEDLVPAPPLPATWLVLANPLCPAPTAAVFKARQGPYSEADRFSEIAGDAAALADILKRRRNDLTLPARSVTPEISPLLDSLEQLPGSLLTRMSGSGATAFSLFASRREAETAAAALAASQPDWWVAAAPILDGGDVDRLAADTATGPA